MSLALFPVSSNLPRRPGRVPVSTIPAERERHIGAAMLRIAHGFSLKETAAACEVSERTVQLWVKLALGYDLPESRALRARLAARN